MLHRSDLRQVGQGALGVTGDRALTAETGSPCASLYILKPLIVTTDSKELTTVLLYLLSIKIGIAFNFWFLTYQKAI